MKERFEKHLLSLGEGQLERLRKISSRQDASIDVQVRNALEIYCEIVEGDTINQAWQNVKEANDRIVDLQNKLFKVKQELLEAKSTAPLTPTRH